MDADHETFDANQQFFDLSKAAASGGMELDNGGVRYQYTENKVDDFVGYAQQQAIATGKATSADAVPGGKTDYNNCLFNAGLLGHLTEQQQLWFNFSQGFEIPDLAKYYGSGT